MSEHDKHAEDDAELSEFADLLGTLRGGADVEPIDPPASVWAGIESRIEAPVGDLAAARANRDQRGKKVAILVAIAAAVLLVAVPVGLALRDGGEGDLQLAEAELLVLDEVSASNPASAVLIRKEGTDLGVQLETGPITTDGTDFTELWLLRAGPDGTPVEIVSLGPATGSGWYDVDDDLDLDATWLVDVSVEPDDDNHEHSGHSVLRGELALGQ